MGSSGLAYCRKLVAVIEGALRHPKTIKGVDRFRRPSGTSGHVVRYPRVPLRFTMG
jgi:hypothetical protein